MYVRQILFEEPISELNNEPLFSNAAALARELINAKLHGKPGKERSLGSYLAQVITSNSRPAPQGLRTAILRAVELRCRKMTELACGEVMRKVEKAFARDDKIRHSSPMSAEALFQKLLEASEQSSLQFIVTPRTAEDVRTERSSDLTQILLRRTGLAALAQEDDRKLVNRLIKASPGLPEVSYVFNVPSEAHGLSWWETLYSRLTGMAIEQRGLDFDGKGIREAIRKLNERRVLTVQMIPQHMCTIPVVVFDPHLPSASGFVLFYHGSDEDSSDRVSVARMDNWSVGIWTRYAFHPIVQREVDVRTIPFP